MLSKKVWRRLFNEYEIGDKVQVIDKAWIYKDLKGIVIKTTKGQGRLFGQKYILFGLKERT